MKKLVSLTIGLLIATAVVRYQPEDKFVKPVEKVIPAVVDIQVIATTIHPIVQLLMALKGIPQTEEGLKELLKQLGEDVTQKNINQLLIKIQIGGSGVYVSSKGYILTCAHLFKEWYSIDSISVSNYKNETVAGSIVLVGDQVDLAVIKTTFYNTTPFVKLADPRKLKVGQDVFAIGSPLGLAFSVTSGIISALYRDFSFSYNMTQSDTVLNPGNSGGPLFNIKGELVGINSFMIPPVNAAIFTGLGFSVQAGQCLEFLVQTSRTEKELRNKKWISLLYRWL